jgi:hypothetical protein
MVLELRPAHDPRKTWGFVGVVISVADLSASVWLWHRENGTWETEKVITIPAEPADAAELPPALQPFGATWDEIFYPDGVGAWAARIDADTETGGMTVDSRFFPHGDDFRGLRVHQTRLQGGDASSDSYCFVD